MQMRVKEGTWEMTQKWFGAENHSRHQVLLVSALDTPLQCIQ